MANSVVKVTQSSNNDGLIVVIGEDGRIVPDRTTVEAYLRATDGETDIQMMQIERSDSKSVQIAVDTLTFCDKLQEDSATQDIADEISRNLRNLRMDHDYTPLTHDDQLGRSVASKTNDDDQVSPQTVTVVDVSGEETSYKVTKRAQKTVQRVIVPAATAPVVKIKPIPSTSESDARLSAPDIFKVRNEPSTQQDSAGKGGELKLSTDVVGAIDKSKSFSIIKNARKSIQTKLSENQSSFSKKVSKIKDVDKPATLKQTTPKKTEVETATIQEEQHPSTPTDKKTPAKKEKKVQKFVPDDYALFSTPDIIRRVGTNKQEVSSAANSDLSRTPKLVKSLSVESNNKVDDSSPTAFNNDLRRASLGASPAATTTTVIAAAAAPALPLGNFSNASTSNVSAANVGTAAIKDESSETFAPNLDISESADGEKQFGDNNLNLETSSLDLDQSILDNINSELISEDILLQIAQSLATNTELQSALEKSLNEDDMSLDQVAPHVNVPASDNPPVAQHNYLPQTTAPKQQAKDAPATVSGTQVIRSDGRVVVIPPLERPTTRSRKNKVESETSASRILDDQHVSGTELDSSSDDNKSDDDPDKLWCICNQPHNNRFMICCDNCEEWYHGKCVNVTKAMGKLMEQQGKEWICVYCKDSSIKRPSAAAKRKRKASRNSSTDLGSEDGEKTPSAKAPASSVPGCLVCGKACRTNSIYCSDPCILKHAEGVGKVVVYNSKTGNILSGNNVPNAANIDKWLQQNPQYQVVRPQNSAKSSPKHLTQSKLKIVKNPPNKGGVSLAVRHKEVNVGILPHAPKHQTTQQTPADKKTPIKSITSVKIISKHTPKIKLTQPHSVAVSISEPKSKAIQPSLKTVNTTPPPSKEKPMPQKTPKSRQGEETVAPNSNNKQESIRENVKKTLHEQLMNRLKMVEDIKLEQEEVTKISSEIESQLYKCFGDTGQKYRNKYRSLIFNIKDGKNQTLWRRICEKSINPYQLVRLSSDDLASQELALWRERENKHQLDMITKSELEQLGSKRQYVFKTHKGEQELENDRPSEGLENTEVITALKGESSQHTCGEQKKDSIKDKGEKRSSKHDRDGHKSGHKSDRKRRHEERTSNRNKSKRKRSRSKEEMGSKHGERSRESRDRHKKSSHKSSRHKKDSRDNSAEKLDKKSKEILDQLVDSKLVAPLEDRLWKHVSQEDMTSAPLAESDSDHEPTSTVTIPTPPRAAETEEQLTQSQSVAIETDSKSNASFSDSFEKDNELGSRSPPVKSQTDYLWKGVINMIDVAHISITAHEVSGDCWGLGDELPETLDVVGRIPPETVWEYIGKMKCSNSKVISLIRLKAINMEEKMPYLSLYTYLSSRNRLGVVKSPNKAVKDFYILPLANQKPIPQALLPLNGPGFEESRPALLLGIIVRDRRKRPSLSVSVQSKKYKVESPIGNVSLPRSYTPPPTTSDSKAKETPIPIVPEETSEETQEEEDKISEDDEPYTPEDSDPDTTPTTVAKTSGTLLETSDISHILTGSVKTTSFLDTGLGAQTFEPFKTKFDTIPGLEDSAAISSDTHEIEKKMQELEQRIAMQKAEIQNMSQNIVASSSGSSDIANPNLANIALPSNLQQILDSIKGINSLTDSFDASTVTSASDLTMPLLLPKISSRSTASTSAAPSFDVSRSKKSEKSANQTEKTASVLSSLSEEDLIRKAAEMLGETEESVRTENRQPQPAPPFQAYDPEQPPIPGLDS